MNGFTDFDRKPLTVFLNNEEAPPGYVYLINSQPAVQVDFFEKFYTLFWLGSITVESFLSYFIEIFNKVKPRRSLLRPHPAFKGFISIVKKRHGVESAEQTNSSDKVLYSREYEPFIFYREADYLLLQDNVNTLTGPDISGVASILIELKAQYFNRELQFSLWADTNDSPKSEKEVGITSNLPLKSSTEDLLFRTSLIAKDMPRPECKQFFNLIRRDISQRGYY